MVANCCLFFYFQYAIYWITNILVCRLRTILFLWLLKIFIIIRFFYWIFR